MTKLAVIRVRTGRGDEAMRLFHQAVEREPGNAEALLYLAGALASSGRASEALPYFERLLKEFEQSSYLELARKRVDELKSMPQPQR